MSSVVVSNLPATGILASGSRPGYSSTPVISNDRARRLYNSNRLTSQDRISLQAAQRRGEGLTGWMRRRGVR